jgi:glycosyltransferase involved in cell wall biosynthesis
VKILIVSDEGRHYARIVEELRKRNRVDHVFISARWEKENGDYHIPKLFGRHLGYKFLTVMIVHYLLLRNNYDFCVTDYRSAFMPLIFLVIKNYANFIKTKFIHDLRTIPVEYDDCLSKTVEKRFYMQLCFANRFYQAFTIITVEMEKHIKKKYINITKPLGIWESGVDVSIYRPLRTTRPLKQKIGFQDKDFICFYHGTFADKRGVIELIEAFTNEMLRKKDIKLLMLGRGNNYSEMQEMILNHSLQNTVKIHDWVEYNEVPEYIAIADLCIVPLPDIEWWRVSTPLKLMDYIACGKNILMTNMVAHRNVVGEKSRYFFIDQIFPESLAKGIEEAYNVFMSNKNEFYQRGIIEREKLVSNISWESRSRLFEEFLAKNNEEA